jgi:hypothetical protein
MESLERFVMLATSNDITRAAVDHGHVSARQGSGCNWLFAVGDTVAAVVGGRGLMRETGWTSILSGRGGDTDIAHGAASVGSLQCCCLLQHGQYGLIKTCVCIGVAGATAVLDAACLLCEISSSACAVSFGISHPVHATMAR